LKACNTVPCLHELFVAGKESVVPDSTLEEVELDAVRVAKLEMFHATWERLDLWHIEARCDDVFSIVFDIPAFEREMIWKMSRLSGFVSERHEKFDCEAALSQRDEGLFHSRILVSTDKLETEISTIERDRLFQIGNRDPDVPDFYGGHVSVNTSLL
jgi:hypothetical protein